MISTVNRGFHQGCIQVFHVDVSYSATPSGPASESPISMSLYSIRVASENGPISMSLQFIRVASESSHVYVFASRARTLLECLCIVRIGVPDCKIEDGYKRTKVKLLSIKLSMVKCIPSFGCFQALHLYVSASRTRTEGTPNSLLECLYIVRIDVPEMDPEGG